MLAIKRLCVFMVCFTCNVYAGDSREYMNSTQSQYHISDETKLIVDEMKGEVKEGLQNSKYSSDNVVKAVSPELKEKIQHVLGSEQYQENIKNGKSRVNAFFSENDESNKQIQFNNDRVVIFVSKSMPTITLRRYAKDLAKIGGGNGHTRRYRWP